ncbi:hypothetical protein HJD18_10070 [Thermoleophilia bacterium SCSIO 60948]|nr:hypothetical protein HJD18_10070 [Thermoleophilia bacterium SCSIO 60948]
MAKLIRFDRSGHSTLAEWELTDDRARAQASRLLEGELERGMIASASRAGGEAEVVRALPADAELVILRRPIVGG